MIPKADLGGLGEVLLNHDPERIARVEEHMAQLALAQDLLAMREAAGLSQRQPADPCRGEAFALLSRTSADEE
jgi:hypothetical protein